MFPRTTGSYRSVPSTSVCRHVAHPRTYLHHISPFGTRSSPGSSPARGGGRCLPSPLFSGIPCNITCQVQATRESPPFAVASGVGQRPHRLVYFPNDSGNMSRRACERFRVSFWSYQAIAKVGGDTSASECERTARISARVRLRSVRWSPIAIQTCESCRTKCLKTRVLLGASPHRVRSGWLKNADLGH